jgi:hypothetical protein
MSWIYRINNLPHAEKEGIYRILIPSSLYHRFKIHPLSFSDAVGKRTVRFFFPPGDRTCLVELKLAEMEDPLYSIQLSDTNDFTQVGWDFLFINDPASPRFLTHIDENGRDTLFGWASRNIEEERKAVEAQLFPGQTRRGLGLTGEAIDALEFFCRIFDIKSMRLEALFYHNAVTYERHGFSYFSGYAMMKRINELFQPGEALHKALDGSTPFRKPEFARTIRGRSWAIHDGVLLEAGDQILDEGWGSPVMYRMVGKPRHMITFPDPIY